MDGTITNLDQYPQITLEGRNLGEIETRYFGDMQHIRADIYEPNSTKKFYTLHEEDSARIRQIENLFRETQDSADSTPIKQLKIDQEGKVILSEGQMFHKIPGLKPDQKANENQAINSISQYGILASEWFGILESENEGRFCCFFDSAKNNNSIGREDIITFTIDQENPALQKLLLLDYFRYYKTKLEKPEAIEKSYSKEDIPTLEFIENLSPGAKSILRNHPSWKAIPGGIPAKYINGICIDGPRIYSSKANQDPEAYSNGEDETYFRKTAPENVERLSELFPNATIFRRDGTVLYHPQEKTETSDINNNETN